MNKFSLLLVACAVLFGIKVQSQSAGNFLYNNQYSANTDRAVIQTNVPNGSMVTLKAEVMMNVRATSYTAIFSISQNGRDVMEVDSTMSGRISQIRYALGMMGIAENDIHIDAVSMVPTYAFKLEEKKFSKRSTEIPTGFEMKKNIHILFKHHDLLDRIISEMAFAEVYDLVKVEYNIDGMQSYYEELRTTAISVIGSKESTYNSLHFHLDAHSMSDGFNSVFPMERYKSYTAFYSGSSAQAVSYARSMQEMNNIYVQGKNNTINIDKTHANDAFYQQFTVQTAEKNRTIFYDRMPYNQFDKVLNADMEEPCIQLFYSLIITYNMITEEQYKQNIEQKELQKQALSQGNGRRRAKKGRAS